MINLLDLKKTVDAKFWNRASKLQIHISGEREALLEDLSKKLNSGVYSPGSPEIIMEGDKGFGIVRHIPVFNMLDYSVYYFCVKKLEPVLAKKRVQNTYGGWSMSGRLRDLEDSEAKSIDTFYSSSFAYNPKAGAKYYGEFNSKLYKGLLKYKAYKNFNAVEFDIANYYDNVRLDILERQIRADSDFHETEVLNLLFYFLNYRDRRLSNYGPQHVGLPQDAIGDSSRMLANYYIQGYDEFMRDLLSSNAGEYFRFADDQFIFCRSSDVKKLMQAASRRLFELGLNINQLKVKTWNLDDLEKYRSFQIFDILRDIGRNTSRHDLRNRLNEFAEQVFAISNPDELKKRGYPLINKLISFDFNLLRPDFRAQLLGKAMNKEFIYSSRGYYLTAVYKRLRAEEKKDFINLLVECSEESVHNAFHYELIAFSDQVNATNLRRKFLKRIIFLEKQRKKII